MKRTRKYITKNTHHEITRHEINNNTTKNLHIGFTGKIVVFKYMRKISGLVHFTQKGLLICV